MDIANYIPLAFDVLKLAALFTFGCEVITEPRRAAKMAGVAAITSAIMLLS